MTTISHSSANSPLAFAKRQIANLSEYRMPTNGYGIPSTTTGTWIG